MNGKQLKQIIEKIKYTTTTAKGQRYSVDVDSLYKEIKTLQIEQLTKQREYNIIKKLGFKEIQKDLFRVYEKDYVLFFDYRMGERRSWALNMIEHTKKDKTELEIYKSFKQQTSKNSYIKCDNCGSSKVELYGSVKHPVRKYKCNACSRVFEVE